MSSSVRCPTGRMGGKPHDTVTELAREMGEVYLRMQYASGRPLPDNLFDMLYLERYDV